MITLAQEQDSVYYEPLYKLSTFISHLFWSRIICNIVMKAKGKQNNSSNNKNIQTQIRCVASFGLTNRKPELFDYSLLFLFSQFVYSIRIRTNCSIGTLQNIDTKISSTFVQWLCCIYRINESGGEAFQFTAILD